MDSQGPQVPIIVQRETGVWTTDGQPMIYVPRHFFVNNHTAVEEALGRKVYAEILYGAGYKSAWQWCEREAATHGITGIDVFRHYMARLSQRGWGRFSVVEVDERTGAARVRIDHSVFVLQQGEVGRPVCYMFAGWFPGSLEWAGRSLGRDWWLTGEERHCAAEGAHRHCLFEVWPRADAPWARGGGAAVTG
jgi:predicted hydrocarbon binding protein